MFTGSKEITMVATKVGSKTSKGLRLNPFEHALRRPDVYIGSTTSSIKTEWCFDRKTGKIARCAIEYNSGLVRLFIEIL